MSNENTSEYNFGVSEQPEENCPYIDRAIRDLLYNCEYDTNSIRSETIEVLENVRNRFDILRSWGQEWKDLCKEQATQIKKLKQQLK